MLHQIHNYFFKDMSRYHKEDTKKHYYLTDKLFKNDSVVVGELVVAYANISKKC